MRMEGRERAVDFWRNNTGSEDFFQDFFVNVHESVDFPFISEFHSS